MSSLSRWAPVLWAGLLLQVPLGANPIVAYDVAAGQPGNQAWTGTIGMIFQVNAPLTVLSLGAFDSTQDGFAGTIDVGVFAGSGPNAGLLVPGLFLSLTGSGDTLIGGSRFRNLASPVVLAPGSYVIAAQGFSASDLNGNVRCTAAITGGACLPANAFSLSTLNTGGGLITFGAPLGAEANLFSPMGSGFVYPTSLLAESPAVPNAFLGGTFQFDVPTTTAAPEPISFSLVGVSLLAIGLLKRRRGPGQPGPGRIL